MHHRSRLPAVALAVVLAHGSAFAQGAVPPPVPDLALATLEDLMRIRITTASRTAEHAMLAPARVQVVSARQILSRGYRSLADLLKDLADFKVDIAADADLPTQLTVQGSRGANRVVLLLDGIRVSSPTGEPLPILANYPVHNARQVEIVYGPASALYGADAFSAVVNVISKDAEEARGLSVQTSVGQFGLFNQTATWGHSFGSGASFVVDGQFQHDRQPDLSRYYPDDFGGLQGQRTGTFDSIFGPMTPERPVSAAFDIPLSAHSIHATFRAGGLHVSLLESRSRVSTAPAYTPDNAVYNDDAFNRNDLIVGAAAYTREIGRLTSTSTATFSRHELHPESGYWNVFSGFAKSYKYAYGSVMRAEQQFGWRAGARATITVGGIAEHFFAIPQTADLSAPIRSHDQPGLLLGTSITDDFHKVRYSNTGGYAQIQYAASERLALTVGTRADYNTRFGATFNPRAGVVLSPTARTTVKVLYGTAFLAPSPYQAYAHWGSFYTTDGGATFASDYWHLPNPDLKPQRKQTIETHVIHGLRAGWSLNASLFATRATNLIQESDPSQAYAGLYHGWPVTYIDFPVNDGRETNYGGSIGLDVLKSISAGRRFEGRIALAVVDGRVWNRGSPNGELRIGAVAPLQLRLGADLDWDGWTMAPRLAVVSRQRVLATRLDAGQPVRETVPGYATLDVNVRRNEVFRHVGLFLTLENAFDARYRHINTRAFTNPEELLGAPQNPRRITVGFDLRLR